MAVKAILVLCAQALLVQIAFGQCLSRMTAPYGYDSSFTPAVAATPCGGFGAAYDSIGAGYGGFGAGYGVAPLAGVAPASGGGLPIASASPIPPSGLSVASENAIEGILAVAGDMPFVSAVALEGALPTAGAGSVAYGCGDGSIGIVRADVAPALDVADGLAYGTGFAATRGFATPAVGLNAPAFGLGAPALGLAAPARRGYGCGAIY